MFLCIVWVNTYYLEDKMEEERSSLYNFKTQNISSGSDQPAPKEWYYIEPLRRKGNTVGLKVFVHPSAHKVICEQFDKSTNDIKYAMKEYGISEFISPKDSKVWGFGEVFLTKVENDEWYSYSADFTNQNWQSISYSLIQIFSFLGYGFKIKEGKEADLPQLFTIENAMLSGQMNGAGFNVTASPYVRKWILDIGTDEDVSVITKSMCQAYYMYNWGFTRKEKRSLIWDFRMWASKDRFGLSVLGNCACMGVDGIYYEKDINVPYELHPHNMDNVYQQLSMLVGFAEISNLVRKSLQTGRS